MPHNSMFDQYTRLAMAIPKIFPHCYTLCIDFLGGMATSSSCLALHQSPAPRAAFTSRRRFLSAAAWLTRWQGRRPPTCCGTGGALFNLDSKIFPMRVCRAWTD